MKNLAIQTNSFETASGSLTLHNKAKDGFANFYQPQWWDEVMHSPSKQDIYYSILAIDPNLHIEHRDIILFRQATILANLLDYKTALEKLNLIDELPCEGSKRRCLGGMCLYEDITSTPFEVSDFTLLGLEDTYYGEYALAIAHGELGNHSEGARRLQRIRNLLPLIGFERRKSIVNAELARQLMESGEPQSDLLEYSITEASNPGVKVWMGTNLVLSLLSQGEFAEAQKQARTLPNQEVTAMVKAFLTQGKLGNSRTPYGMIANCLYGVLEKTGNIPLDALSSYKEEYSQQLTAYMLLAQAVQTFQTERYRLAQSFLTKVKAKQPLIAFLKHFIQFAILSKTGEPGSDLALQEIRVALARLSEEKDVLTLAAKLLPETFALLCLSKVIKEDHQALVPVLFGQHIRYNNELIDIDNDQGLALLHHAIKQDDLDPYTLDPALNHFCSQDDCDLPPHILVNIASLWHCAKRLESCAYLESNEDSALVWQDLMTWLLEESPALQEVLAD